jgi:hypothetical protein
MNVAERACFWLSSAEWLRGRQKMRLFPLRLIPRVSHNSTKFPPAGLQGGFLSVTTFFFLFVILVLFLLEYFSLSPHTPLPNESAEKRWEWPSFKNSRQASASPEVLNLAQMIRLITDDRLSPMNALRYAELIFQSSQKFNVNPLEIIALIMVESDFQEKSINRETGDYGLGQINWRHWGKDNELTPQDLLDPAINITLMCQVYKFFGEDFGRYHRGNGPQCAVYVKNVNTVLSALNAFAESIG